MPGFNINNINGSNFETNTGESVRAHRWSIDRLGPIASTSGIAGWRTWYAKSFTFPSLSGKVEKAQGAALEYKFAAGIEYGTANVTFYDMVLNNGTTTLALLRRWGARVYGENYNQIGFADEYKEQSVFTMDDGSGFPLFRIILHNSWPSKIDHAELSYTESAISEVTVELTFDWYTTPEVSGRSLPGDAVTILG